MDRLRWVSSVAAVATALLLAWLAPPVHAQGAAPRAARRGKAPSYGVAGRTEVAVRVYDLSGVDAASRAQWRRTATADAQAVAIEVADPAGAIERALLALQGLRLVGQGRAMCAGNQKVAIEVPDLRYGRGATFVKRDGAGQLVVAHQDIDPGVALEVWQDPPAGGAAQRPGLMKLLLRARVPAGRSLPGDPAVPPELGPPQVFETETRTQVPLGPLPQRMVYCAELLPDGNGRSFVTIVEARSSTAAANATRAVVASIPGFGPLDLARAIVDELAALAAYDAAKYLPEAPAQRLVELAARGDTLSPGDAAELRDLANGVRDRLRQAEQLQVAQLLAQTEDNQRQLAELEAQTAANRARFEADVQASRERLAALQAQLGKQATVTAMAGAGAGLGAAAGGTAGGAGTAIAAEAGGTVAQGNAARFSKIYAFQVGDEGQKKVRVDIELGPNGQQNPPRVTVWDADADDWVEVDPANPGEFADFVQKALQEAQGAQVFLGPGGGAFNMQVGGPAEGMADIPGFPQAIAGPQGPAFELGRLTALVEQAQKLAKKLQDGLAAAAPDTKAAAQEAAELSQVLEQVNQAVTKLLGQPGGLGGFGGLVWNPGLARQLGPAWQGGFPRVVVEGRPKQFTGIGAIVTSVEPPGGGKPQMVVRQIIPNSPAEKAGLTEGDVIVAVDDEEVPTELTQGVKRIVGPEGSVVKLTVRREGQEELLHFEVTRQKVTFDPDALKQFDVPEPGQKAEPPLDAPDAPPPAPEPPPAAPEPEGTGQPGANADYPVGLSWMPDLCPAQMVV